MEANPAMTLEITFSTKAGSDTSTIKEYFTFQVIKNEITVKKTKAPTSTQPGGLCYCDMVKRVDDASPPANEFHVRSAGVDELQDKAKECLVCRCGNNSKKQEEKDNLNEKKVPLKEKDQTKVAKPVVKEKKIKINEQESQIPNLEPKTSSPPMTCPSPGGKSSEAKCPCCVFKEDSKGSGHSEYAEYGTDERYGQNWPTFVKQKSDTFTIGSEPYQNPSGIKCSSQNLTYTKGGDQDLEYEEYETDERYGQNWSTYTKQKSDTFTIGNEPSKPSGIKYPSQNLTYTKDSEYEEYGADELCRQGRGACTKKKSETFTVGSESVAEMDCCCSDCIQKQFDKDLDKLEIYPPDFEYSKMFQPTACSSPHASLKSNKSNSSQITGSPRSETLQTPRVGNVQGQSVSPSPQPETPAEADRAYLFSPGATETPPTKEKGRENQNEPVETPVGQTKLNVKQLTPRISKTKNQKLEEPSPRPETPGEADRAYLFSPGATDLPLSPGAEALAELSRENRDYEDLLLHDLIVEIYRLHKRNKEKTENAKKQKATKPLTEVDKQLLELEDRRLEELCSFAEEVYKRRLEKKDFKILDTGKKLETNKTETRNDSANKNSPDDEYANLPRKSSWYQSYKQTIRDSMNIKFNMNFDRIYSTLTDNRIITKPRVHVTSETHNTLLKIAIKFLFKTLGKVASFLFRGSN